MKFHRYLGVALVITASFIHTGPAMACSSNCAACWKDGDTNGADIKPACTNGQCGTRCPTGYSGAHCAKEARCMYVGLSVALCIKPIQLSQGISHKCVNCPGFGPCWCGTIEQFRVIYCKNGDHGKPRLEAARLVPKTTYGQHHLQLERLQYTLTLCTCVHYLFVIYLL